MATCYCQSTFDSYLTQFDTSGIDVPCTNYVGTQSRCCQSTHTCLFDGICFYTNDNPGGSGFYISACTDPEYKDEACLSICTDLALPDIVWNPSTQRWNCCGVSSNGNPTCGDPTGEFFSARSPQSLLGMAGIPTTATVSVTPSVTSSSTAKLLSGSYYINVSGSLVPVPSPSTSSRALTTPIPPSITSTTSERTVSSSSAATTPPVNGSSTSTSSLSPAITTGIGVAAFLFVAALITAALTTCWIIRHRRQQPRSGISKENKSISTAVEKEGDFPPGPKASKSEQDQPTRHYDFYAEGIIKNHKAKAGRKSKYGELDGNTGRRSRKLFELPV